MTSPGYASNSPDAPFVVRVRDALDRGRSNMATWPRTQYADWVPATTKREPLVAATVFTEFVLPGDTGFAATCVCGGTYHSTNRQLMRKGIGEHRCDEQLGHPAGLLPDSLDVDEPSDELLDHVLRALRALP